MQPYIRISHRDNVAVALVELPQGTEVDFGDLRFCLNESIQAGHKFAIRPIARGEDILKYGSPIGHALTDILPGVHVHIHNLATNLSGANEYSYNPDFKKTTSPIPMPNFRGYLRRNGQAGIRNELWIIPTVGCVNGTANRIKSEFIARFQPEKADAIEVFTHNYGCSQLGDDHSNTRKALANLACHPNAGGVLVLGLGCENNQISALKAEMEGYDPERVRFLVAQEVGDEIEAGITLLHEVYLAMQNDFRQELPFSKLKIGLKCGGSDGLSGITANPLSGLLTDAHTSWGGTAVLTEVPEMFGAETLLMQRAMSEQVFRKTVGLINNFKEYFIAHNQPVYENPSPGNKQGGITTLEEKSLGCTQKGGNATVTDVLEYGQPSTIPGLNLLNAPGNDLVATSALGFSGCQMVLFTTGRGTPFGSFIPTVKISSNSDLFNKKPTWIDFNAGTMTTGTSPNEILLHFLDYLVRVANGEKVNHEKNGFREIAIFKTGVTL